MSTAPTPGNRPKNTADISAPAYKSLTEEWRQSPIMVIPDHTPFQLRKAALDAAATLYAGTLDFSTFWPNVLTFEDYLRDGAKP